MRAVLEVMTSLALNVEAGFFVALMFWRSRQALDRELIPLALGPAAAYTWVFVAAYFLAAVLYDLVVSGTKYLGARATIALTSLSLAAAAGALLWRYFQSRRRSRKLQAEPAPQVSAT